MKSENLMSTLHACRDCGFENPIGHLFCENCGTSLTDSDIAPVYINTLKHQCQLITLNVTYRRYWYLFLTVVAAITCHLIFFDIQYTAAIACFGLILAYVIPNRFQSIVHLPIPPEILSKNIIAYGPANKAGCFFFSSGLLYFLDDGFFYKSYSLKGDTYSQFIEKSNIELIRGLEHYPIGRSSAKISIEGGGRVLERFNVYNRSQWLMLFYKFGMDVCLEEMVFSQKET